MLAHGLLLRSNIPIWRVYIKWAEPIYISLYYYKRFYSAFVLLYPQRKTIFNTEFSLMRGFMPTYKDSMQNKASKILRLLTQSEEDFSKGKSTSQKNRSI
jgi:hypothetical protein